uniref:Tubulin/FtsZ GTPase domain-containing protein n=1 Tax=Oreochromis niloticus TaxID=8128 RepID=A0A669EVR3_ORENI
MREIVHLQAGQCGNQIGAKQSCVCVSVCIWSQALWTLSALGLSDRSSGQTTFPLCARTHSADVRCQEHDGRLRPTPRPLPHRGRCVPWAHVHEGGG